jgi:hypothetical protein
MSGEDSLKPESTGELSLDGSDSTGPGDARSTDEIDKMRAIPLNFLPDPVLPSLADRRLARWGSERDDSRDI